MPGASAPGLFLEIEMPNKHLKSNKGGMLGKAKRALGGRQQQLDAMEAKAMGKKKK
jgi:hypothetical protein